MAEDKEDGGYRALMTGFSPIHWESGNANSVGFAAFLNRFPPSTRLTTLVKRCIDRYGSIPHLGLRAKP